jgi:integrase/recombinase XerC
MTSRPDRSPADVAGDVAGDVAAGLVPGVDRSLQEFVEHLRLERGRSPHTVRAYRADLTDLLTGLTALPGLDLARLRCWLADAHAAGAARSTLARKAAAARTFTAWAHRRGLLPADPGARLTAPRPRSALPTVLDREQAAAVIDAAGARAEPDDPVAVRDRLVVELLYATGVRVAELCGLDLDDVDEDRRALRVVGKGDRERTVVYGVPAERALRAWRESGRPALVRAVARRARRPSGPARGPGGGAPGGGGGPGRPGHRAARPASCRRNPHAR